MMDATVFHNNHGAKCPHCGYVNKPCDSDGLLYDASVTDYECDKCEKSFSVDIRNYFEWITSTTAKANK